MNRGLFSSLTSEWSTPPDLFARLDAEFGFTLDVCARPENAKCANFFTLEQDGLEQEWAGTCWMNPPYGRQIGRWIQKAWESAEKALVVCLVPARTDTSWWHDYCMRGEIRLIRGRLKFGGADGIGQGQYGSAPFPSAVVIFRPRKQGAP